MILASFSLDWFMTIPGMLITGGVLFLIIALVIFIVTGNKKTKTNKEVVEAQNSSKQEAVAAATPVVEQSTVTTNEPVVTTQPSATSEPVVPTTPVSSMAEKVAPQEVEPAVFTTPIPQDVVPTPQPVFNNQVSNIVESSIPAVNSTNIPTTSPVNQTTVSTQSPVMPVVPTIEQTPIVNQPVMPEIPVKEEKKEVIQTPTVDMPRPIYGGVSPVVPNVSHEEHRPIYGGANPLENTQSVPIVPPRSVATNETKVEVPKVDIPVTPTVSNDIFGTSPVVSTTTVPTVEQPVSSTVTKNKQEEIESLF